MSLLKRQMLPCQPRTATFNPCQDLNLEPPESESGALPLSYKGVVPYKSGIQNIPCGIIRPQNGGTVGFEPTFNLGKAKLPVCMYRQLEYGKIGTVHVESGHGNGVPCRICTCINRVAAGHLAIRTRGREAAGQYDSYLTPGAAAW